MGLLRRSNRLCVVNTGRKKCVIGFHVTVTVTVKVFGVYTFTALDLPLCVAMPMKILMPARKGADVNEEDINS